MRIGTWNLERGGRRGSAVAAQNTVLAGIDADVWVLTEPPAARSMADAGTVVSAVERDGDLGKEAWVAIAGSGVEPVGDPLPFDRLAAIALVKNAPEPLLVYGSVLPWPAVVHHAPELARPGERSAAMFSRVLQEQLSDLLDLQCRFPRHLLVWAGDFNQSVVGANFGASKVGRALLHDALDRLGFAASNADAPHAVPSLCAIDLICGPRDRSVQRLDPIDPMFEGRALSDHAGSVVEV